MVTWTSFFSPQACAHVVSNQASYSGMTCLHWTMERLPASWRPRYFSGPANARPPVAPPKANAAAATPVRRSSADLVITSGAGFVELDTAASPGERAEGHGRKRENALERDRELDRSVRVGVDETDLDVRATPVGVPDEEAEPRIRRKTAEAVRDRIPARCDRGAVGVETEDRDVTRRRDVRREQLPQVGAGCRDDVADAASDRPRRQRHQLQQAVVRADRPAVDARPDRGEVLRADVVGRVVEIPLGRGDVAELSGPDH